MFWRAEGVSQKSEKEKCSGSPHLERSAHIVRELKIWGVFLGGM